MITIRNDFTNSEIRVDETRDLTVRKILGWRRRLCSDNCTSGDCLGGRGPQREQEAYDRLIDRAARVILTGF